MSSAVGEPPLPVTFAPRRKFSDRRWLHFLLFVLTCLTTTLVGAEHYATYVSDFGRHPVTLSISLILHGLWYSATILLILGAHELGHYLACRYYQVDASLPFFIPMPLVLTGTLGAFIRIREPIPTKRMLFDIGIAGPLAGFVFAVPALFIGVAMSPVVRVPPNLVGFNLGEPLLFRAATWTDLGAHREWLFSQPAPDGLCRMVRTARDRIESLSGRAARWRPHFVRGTRPPIDDGHARVRSARLSGSHFFRGAGSSGHSCSWL